MGQLNLEMPDHQDLNSVNNLDEATAATSALHSEIHKTQTENCKQRNAKS